MIDSTELTQAVINLHTIARLVEKEFGQEGQLSLDIRRCADRLATVIKPIESKG